MNGVQKGIKIFAICLAFVIIINIFSFMMYGLSFFLPNSRTYETKTFQETYQNINRIDLETASSDVIFTTGTEFKVEAQDVLNGFSSNVKNGTLKISERNRWFMNAKNRGTILITVPETAYLEEIDLDAGAGAFDLTNLKANKFDLDMGAGSLKISNSKFNETSIDGGAGKIEITNSFLNNLEFQAGVGKVDLSSYITGNSEIECGVGELNLNLLGRQEDYQVRLEKGIGSITVNGVDQKSDTTFGTGENRIQVEGGVGSIHLSFQN